MDEIKYIADRDVDAEMDIKIRDLLVSCFPDQPVFTKQRFYHEMPAHRWFIMNKDRMMAHVALHEKKIKVGAKMLKTGGIAEVAVHPDARGPSYLRSRDRAAVGHGMEELHFAQARAPAGLHAPSAGSGCCHCEIRRGV